MSLTDQAANLKILESALSDGLITRDMHDVSYNEYLPYDYECENICDKFEKEMQSVNYRLSATVLKVDVQVQEKRLLSTNTYHHSILQAT